LFGTKPLKAQNDKKCQKFDANGAPWLRLCPQETDLALAGDLAPADTTLVIPAVNV